MRSSTTGGVLSELRTELKNEIHEPPSHIVYSVDYQSIKSCLLTALSRLIISNGPGRRLRHRCSSQYLRISPLHWEFHDPLPNSSPYVSNAVPRLSPGISRLTVRTAYAPFTPSHSEQR